MQAHGYAIQRWEGEGGALRIEPPKQLQSFWGRRPNPATHRRRMAQLAARNRMQGVAWFVGLPLLILVLLNFSWLLSVSQ